MHAFSTPYHIIDETMKVSVKKKEIHHYDIR